MGKGMIRNLVNKMPQVESFVVWNRSKAAVDELKAAFPSGRIHIAATPAEVVQRCGITYSMMSTMEASVAVFDCEDGVISGITAGKTLIDCATLTPERMMSISDAVKSKGGKFMEAPVSGSKVPAETGTLIFLCGGPEEIFEDLEVKAGLDAMGKASFYLGEVGSGSRMKLVVNGLMGTMMSAFTESMHLCKESNLPQDTLLKVLDLGAMANPMFKGKGPCIINENYGAHFPLKHQQKDMRLALELAKDVGVSMPVFDAANKQYEKVLAAHGDEDFCAVMKANVKGE